MKSLIFAFILVTLFACKGKSVNDETYTEDPITGTSISTDSARIMVQAYLPETPILKKNTKCIWFSLSRIDSIYTYLHREKNAGISTDGIRIYFATYPKESEPGKPHVHGFRNTIVIVSTKKDSTNGKKYHKDYFTKLKNGFPFVPENKGELTPPGDEEGALLLH